MTRPVTMSGMIFTNAWRVTTGPCLEVERRESQHFVGVVNPMRRSADEDAPTLAEGLIHTIDLEPDHGLRRREDRPWPRRC